MTPALAPTRPVAAHTQARPGSLQLRVIALVAGLLLLFALASMGLLTWTLAQALQVEQTARNAEAAQTLAAILNRPRADAATLQALADARYALGREDRIRVRSAQGSTLVSLDRAAADAGVPVWFNEAWPIVAPPGRLTLANVRLANLSLASTGIGSAFSDTSQPVVLEAEAGRAWAQQLLWRTVSRSAALLGLLAAAASLLAAAVLRGWLLPWRLRLGPLQGEAADRWALLDDSGVLDARGLARSMHATVRDLRQDVAAQAEQVLRLQRQAQLDSLTGVSLRHHFLGQLQRRLADPQAGHAALLIVRVCDLEALNLRVGRDATDRLLCAVAHLLLTYVDRVSGALAGRLNGGDFALCLPVGGVALETAVSLREALAALPASRNAGALMVVGGVDDLPQSTCSAALAAADAALARAETSEADSVAVDHHGDLVADAAGAQAWRAQIAEALTQARGRLHTTPVCDRQGRTLHLACALHLQLAADGTHQPPRAWLALARRAQLLPRVDLLTLQLALHAIAADGQPRCVRLAAVAWASPGFVAAVRALLQAAPTPARALAIELAEPDPGAAAEGLAAAVAAWVPSGVRLGLRLAHGGATPPDLAALQAAGVAFVTVAGKHLRGVAADEALKAHARGLIKRVRDLGLTALVAGASDAHDLAVLWNLGLDGAAAPQAAPSEVLYETA